jgi:hypothetical protein
VGTLREALQAMAGGADQTVDPRLRAL